MNNKIILKNKIEFGDCREIMRQWKTQGVKAQMCVTSPPYYNLRDYGTASWEGGDENCEHNPQRPDGGARNDRVLPLGRSGIYKDVCKCGAKRVDKQLGLEKTPEEFVQNLVEVFRCVRDILKEDGTLWLILGDSYAGSGKGRDKDGTHSEGGKQGTNLGSIKGKLSKSKAPNLKPKDLIGIPWRVAFALQADGWYLRQDIIWHKPNPMPESVMDRCTKSHEYIFLLTKNKKYYYDNEAIKEKSTYCGDERGSRTDSRRGTECNYMSGTTGEFRNKRDVWTVSTKPYSGAHFATFPYDLILPCILAGSKEYDVVLDPFMGSGTAAMVAKENGRYYLGCELDEENEFLQRKRIEGVHYQTKMF